MNEEQVNSGLAAAVPAPATPAHVPAVSSRSIVATQPTFWHTRYGLVLDNGAKDTVARSLSTYGEWVEQELDTLGALIDEGQVVLEYGAEYGAHTLWLSKLVGDTGQVHVVEPRRYEHIALCSTLALNGLRNVYPVHAALGESGGATVTFAASDEQSEEVSREVSVDNLRLDKLHLIKVNRGGGLLPMLAGAEGALRTHNPTIYFRLSNADLATREIDALKSRGYRCWSHLPYLYSAGNFANSRSNIFPGWVSQNVIATHRDAAAEFVHLHEL
ncbi:hypothetical protein [Dyella terrae]|uniref:hypothetical protein n=1 Tax=Dyella terrae TaxID=522259 RepID=UPI001EFE17B7|nr:hypothetical protein [Dyella terrae]ULU25490.1 hypothetical protein DYST_02422 [Dyella terrae]